MCNTEYGNKCIVNELSGFFKVPNGNCRTGVGCVMSLNQNTLTICNYSQGQIGWPFWNPTAHIKSTYTTNYAPALEVFNDGTGDKLYLGFAGTDSHIYITFYDGTKWSPLTPIGQSSTITTNNTFGLKRIGNQLYVVYKSTIDNTMFFSSSSTPMSGDTWSEPMHINPTYTTNYAPVLEVFNDGTGDKLYLGFTGTNSCIYITFYDGTKWSPLTQIGQPGKITTNNAFGLKRIDNQLCVVYKSTNNTMFFSSSSIPMSRISWINPIQIDSTYTTNYAPVLEAFNDGTGEKLYLGFAGTDSATSSCIYVTSYNDNKWSRLMQVGKFNSSPSVINTNNTVGFRALGNKLYIVYKSSTDNSMWFTYSPNPAYPFKVIGKT